MRTWRRATSPTRSARISQRLASRMRQSSPQLDAEGSSSHGTPPSRRTYLPRIVGDNVMMPADLKRMLDVEHIGIISNEMREVVEELWPELAHKLPPKRPQS